MPNLGIFGGTFDPIHQGHLQIAETALTLARLDQILWIPSLNPPHKSVPLASFDQRLTMVERAIAPYPAFVASDLEGQMGGISYAIDTFQRLQALYQEACWYWIVGLDAFQSLPRWRGSQTLSHHCTWLVAPRASAIPQSTNDDLARLEVQPFEEIFSKNFQAMTTLCDRVAQQMPGGVQWQLLPTPSIAISSSLVRHRCRQGCPIDDLVPASVGLYIKNKNLYSK